MCLSRSCGLRRVSQLHWLLNAGFRWGAQKAGILGWCQKNRQKPPFSDAVVKPDFQRYQGLKVLSQFPGSQVIIDRVRQALVESGNQCLSIPPTLGGEGTELNGEVSHWSGPLADVKQSAVRFSSANWVVEDRSLAVKAKM